MGADATVGTIAVQVVANTGKLDAGMANASRSVNQFATDSSSSLDKYQAALTRVELTGRNAKKAIKEIGFAFGSQGGAIAGVAQTMLTMGPAVGLAVGAMHLFNKVMEKSEEQAKFHNDALELHAGLLKKIGEVNGKIAVAGPFSKGISNDIEKASEKLSELRTKQSDAQSGFWGMFKSADSFKEMDKDIGKVNDDLATLLVTNRELLKLDAAQKVFNKESFNAKNLNKSGTTDRMAAELAADRKLADALHESLLELPRDGTEYNDVLEKERSLRLKINDESDALIDRDKKLHEESEKQADALATAEFKRQEEIDKQNSKNADEFEKHLREVEDEGRKAGKELSKAMRTPFEVFSDSMDEIQDRLQRGDIDQQTFDRASADEADRFAKASDLDASLHPKAGTFSTFDVSQMGDIGAANEIQKVSDPKLVPIHETLLKILAKPTARTTAL